MGKLFHAYPAASPAATYCNHFINKVTKLLDKKALWLLLVKVLWLILRILPIAMNEPLKGLPSSEIRKWQISNFKRTWCIKLSAIVAEVSSRARTTTTNRVISYMTFMKAKLPLLLIKWPGTKRSAWRITKGGLNGYENMTFWPRRSHLYVNMQ